MPLLRFPNKASELTDGIGRLLQTKYEYVLDTDGDDLIVTSMPVLGDLLTQSTEYSLISTPLPEIADSFISGLRPDVEKYFNYDEGPIPVSTKFGLCSEFQKQRINIFLADPSTIHEQLVQYTLPFMRDELDSKRVRLLFLDVIEHQQRVSLTKIVALLLAYDMREVQPEFMEQGVMTHLLPSGIDFIEYLDSMLWISPMSIALPQQRFGSGLYFFKDHPWQFMFEGQAGLNELAYSALSPLDDEDNSLLINAGFFTNHSTKKYFEMLIYGLNKLAAHIYNPIHYVDERQVPNYQLMIQVICNIRLLFSDLMAINATHIKYQRQRLAFSFIDKYANLLLDPSDTRAFKKCLSNEYKEVLIRIVRFHVSPSFGQGLSRKMVQLIEGTYGGLHSKIQRMATNPDHLSSEDSRLNFIWSLRNSKHGMILRRDQFSDVFFSTKGGLPSEVILIPLLISWGMILAPDQVFSFTAKQECE